MSPVLKNAGEGGTSSFVPPGVAPNTPLVVLILEGNRRGIEVLWVTVGRGVVVAVVTVGLGIIEADRATEAL